MCGDWPTNFVAVGYCSWIRPSPTSTAQARHDLRGDDNQSWNGILHQPVKVPVKRDMAPRNPLSSAVWTYLGQEKG